MHHFLGKYILSIFTQKLRSEICGYLENIFADKFIVDAAESNLRHTDECVGGDGHCCGPRPASDGAGVERREH